MMIEEERDFGRNLAHLNNILWRHLKLLGHLIYCKPARLYKIFQQQLARADSRH